MRLATPLRANKFYRCAPEKTLQLCANDRNAKIGLPRGSSRRAGGADADGHRRAAVGPRFCHGLTGIAGPAIRSIHAVHEADPAARQLRARGPLRTVPGLAARDGANAVRELVADLAKAFIAVDVVHAGATDQRTVVSGGAGRARVAAAHRRRHRDQHHRSDGQRSHHRATIDQGQLPDQRSTRSACNIRVTF